MNTLIRYYLLATSGHSRWIYLGRFYLFFTMQVSLNHVLELFFCQATNNTKDCSVFFRKRQLGHVLHIYWQVIKGTSPVRTVDVVADTEWSMCSMLRVRFRRHAVRVHAVSRINKLVLNVNCYWVHHEHHRGLGVVVVLHYTCHLSDVGARVPCK